MSNTAIIIPSAQYVDEQLRMEVGAIPPVVLPIGGKLLLSIIVEKYLKKVENPEFFVLLGQGSDKVKHAVKNHNFPAPINLIQVGKKQDLAATLINGLEKIKLDRFQGIFLNFGDTVIDSDEPFNQDLVFYDDLEETYRWTTFTEKNGQIEKIFDRNQLDSDKKSHVITGSFYFTDAAGFYNSLVSVNTECEISRFYTGLINYLRDKDYKLSKVIKWYDFGHIDNYQDARKKAVNSRYFNQVKIDPEKPIITKQSQNKKKLRDEINWYINLPPALKCYSPQIFDYSLKEEPYIKMEYYGYPALGDLYVHGSYDVGTWGTIINVLLRVIEEFRQFKSQDNLTHIKGCLHEIYVTKTIERLNALRSHKFWQDWFEKRITINGVKYPAIGKIIQEMPEFCAENLLSETQFSVIHGDFCLSNILYDTRTRLVKLIDPRGSFGSECIHGDWRYDAAKLIHSFSGGYEHIINNQFFSIIETNKINYSLNYSDLQKDIKDVLINKIRIKYPEHFRAIQCIESLLLLSMVTLHNDFLNRQSIMLATGIEKFWNLYKR